MAAAPPFAMATTSDVVVVSTARQLSAALAQATPGQRIKLQPGTYTGHFTLRRSGASGKAITLVGDRNAVLDGSSSGYTLHLDGASFVRVEGFTIRGGQKGVVLDGSSHDTLNDLNISHTGDEAVLLRNYSKQNVVSNSSIHDSGMVEPGYGEGIYVGLSRSNWSSGSSRTNGGPDTSNLNQITGNTIWNTTAENVDIKEGTSGGLIVGNHFDGAGLSGANYADSWVDIAGDGWVVRDNTGTNMWGSKLLDGYQTHVILPGWGQGNVFGNNRSQVNAPGFAVNIQTPNVGNVVYTSNTVDGAGRGLSNVKPKVGT